MAAPIPLYKLRADQPQEVFQLDYGNSILRGITRAVVFGPAGPIPFDVVTGTYLTAVSTGFSNDVRENLRGIRNTNETSYWTLPIRTESVNSFSFAWVGIQDGGTSTAVLRDNTNTVGTIPILRNASQWDVRIAGTDFTQAGTFSQGKLYSAVCTGGNTPAYMRLFVDGQIIISSSLAAGASFITPWYIHQNGNTGQGSLNTSFLLAMWDRNLTDAEARELSLNPWQLFEPKRTWFAVGGGVASFKSAWARGCNTVISSGARP